MLWEFLICEETFDVFFRSSCADEVAIDRVKFVLSCNDEEISTGERHFGLTNLHYFDIDSGAVDFFLENSLFPAFLRLVSVTLKIVCDHVDSRGLDPFLILFNSPDLEIFTFVVEI